MCANSIRELESWSKEDWNKNTQRRTARFHCAKNLHGQSTSVQTLESGHAGLGVVRKATQRVRKMKPINVHKQTYMYWEVCRVLKSPRQVMDQMHTWAKPDV